MQSVSMNKNEHWNKLRKSYIQLISNYKMCKQEQQCEAHVNSPQSNSRQIMQYNKIIISSHFTLRLK